MKRLLVPFLTIMLVLSAGLAAHAGSYKDISAAEAKKLMEDTSDLVVIDVSPYFDRGHLPGAVNYPVGSGALDEAIPGLDKSKTYLVYCHADGPAIAGAKKLVEAGFSKVYRLVGNYGAWTAAGYPTEM